MNTEDEGLRSVKFTRGVAKIIGTDIDKPTPVPEKQILDIKKVLESDVKLDPYPYLKKGTHIRLKSGPLMGVEGVLIERKGSYSIVIQIDLLQNGVSAEVSIADVEPI